MFFLSIISVALLKKGRPSFGDYLPAQINDVDVRKGRSGGVEVLQSALRHNMQPFGKCTHIYNMKNINIYIYI